MPMPPSPPAIVTPMSTMDALRREQAGFASGKVVFALPAKSLTEVFFKAPDGDVKLNIHGVYSTEKQSLSIQKVQAPAPGSDNKGMNL